MKQKSEQFFLEELEAALAKEKLLLSEAARVYLAGLLSCVSWEQIKLRTTTSGTLAEGLLLALQQEPGELRDQLLRRVGNSALLLCGLWWRFVDYEAVYRHGSGQDYHERIGRQAFGRIKNELFKELADKFIGVVDVFARISDELIDANPMHTMHAYAALLKTNNRLVEKLLQKQGLIIVDNRGKVN